MSTSMDVSRRNAFLFINFMWIITVISIIPGFWCKECTNIPTHLSSHTLRYEILTSSNASWREEMFSLYPLIESEELAWSGLLPQGKLDKEKSFSAEEEFNWTMLYRGMRYASKMNSPSGENILQEVPLEKVWLDPNSLHGLAQQTNLEYLLMLNVDNLVWSFRKTAGLPTPGTPYGGWESPTIELRGHFVGHYMSSSALMWASTHNTTLKEHMTAVVNALDECQKAIGTGYLSAFPPELFDRFEAIKPVWAPYYTIHKILAGLLDQYTLAGNAQALQITLEMANYFYDRVQNVISQHTIERHWLSLNEETGGMNDVLYRLYTITGDGKHLELAHLFDKPCFLGLLAVQTDGLSGFHANTHIPIVVGSQMRYEVTGDPLYKEIGTYFMDIVNSSHSYATGGTSVNEFWSDPNRLASTLQAENEESCTTYNMLKVARHLFRWTKAMVYADYYERALTNGVLSIQRGREPGVMIYMLPQGPGDSKARSFHGWGTQFNSFWCCYGTGIESFSKLGDSIYFQENGTSPNLYIIQFISSTLTWDAAGVTLKQTVEPLSSWNPYLHVSMVFNFISESKALEADSGESTVNIRIPFWMYVDGAQAMLNAEALSLPYPGNFLTISRQWKSNDNVSLSFPVALRTESIKDDRPQFKSVQAILFGPYLLAGMTDGDWDLQLGNTSSFSDWITAVPAGFASQLFTFGQEWKISGSDESNNNTLVLTNSNTSILMEPFPQEGTDQAAHATFRIIDSSTEKTPKEYKMQKSALAVDFVGKDVYLEPFDHPGMVVAHQGINNTLTIYPRAQLSLANKKPCSLTYCMSLSEGSNAVFKVVPGLDGNQNSVSFESTNLPSCFVYGGTSYQAGQAVLLQCRPVTTDIGFDRAASFISSTGVSTYHPISFIATGSKRSYLLAPLFTFRDESYTVYFNITS